MLKAAVIGVGSMGRNHARVYREMETVDLVCVVDQDPDVAARVGANFLVPHYTDVQMMLEKRKPDLVSLAVPTSLHYEIGKQLIEAGIHVLIEKPIASTIAEGAKLVALAKHHGVVLAVGHIERFNPAVMELDRRLKDGMAGCIYKIHTQRLSPYPPRIRDAGVVIDLASHDIDLIRCLMHEDIARVYGETLRSINSDREDMFNGLMRFRSGAIGVLDVNWMTPTKIRSLTITGARGMFICNLLTQELLFYENGERASDWDTLSVLTGVTEGNMLGFRVHRHEPLAAELNDFVNAVDEGREPAVTGQSGLETLQIATEFLVSGNQVKIVEKADSHVVAGRAEQTDRQTVAAAR